ncbi:MAG: ribosome hibernation-promoting factor, HPF/YfiA family [Propionibacteriaceae bacterium]
MDVNVNGHHCTISAEFRAEVTEKLASIEKFRDRVHHIDVDVKTGEKKHAGTCTVEITLAGKGPVVRAVGTAEDKRVAFDMAYEKLKTQVRKAADRRKQHRGLRAATIAPDLSAAIAAEPEDMSRPAKQILPGGLEVEGDGPLVMREKNFTNPALTLAQALDEMELVGHDFFLYVDAESKLPSVVYRRKGYDYGVIHLTTTS